MGKKEVRFFSVFCSRGDVPKRRCFAKFFYSLTSSFVVVCPPGGSFYFFSLSLLFERLHRERERESESETRLSFLLSSERALFLRRSLLLSFREFRAETHHQWIYPIRFILPLFNFSLSLFSFFVDSLYLLFSLFY